MRLYTGYINSTKEISQNPSEYQLEQFISPHLVVQNTLELSHQEDVPLVEFMYPVLIACQVEFNVIIGDSGLCYSLIHCDCLFNV